MWSSILIRKQCPESFIGIQSYYFLLFFSYFCFGAIILMGVHCQSWVGMDLIGPHSLMLYYSSQGPSSHRGDPGVPCLYKIWQRPSDQKNLCVFFWAHDEQCVLGIRQFPTSSWVLHIISWNPQVSSQFAFHLVLLTLLYGTDRDPFWCFLAQGSWLCLVSHFTQWNS